MIKRLQFIFFALLLCTSQLAFSIHELEHLNADQVAVCDLCLLAASADSAVLGSMPTVFLTADRHPSNTITIPRQRLGNCVTPPARAPPSD